MRELRLSESGRRWGTGNSWPPGAQEKRGCQRPPGLKPGVRIVSTVGAWSTLLEKASLARVTLADSNPFFLRRTGGRPSRRQGVGLFASIPVPIHAAGCFVIIRALRRERLSAAIGVGRLHALKANVPTP